MFGLIRSLSHFPETQNFPLILDFTEVLESSPEVLLDLTVPLKVSLLEVGRLVVLAD